MSSARSPRSILFPKFPQNILQLNNLIWFGFAFEYIQREVVRRGLLADPVEMNFRGMHTLIGALEEVD